MHRKQVIWKHFHLKNQENLKIWKTFSKQYCTEQSFQLFFSTSVFLLILHLILIMPKSTSSGNFSETCVSSVANSIFYFFSLSKRHLKSVEKITLFDEFHKKIKIWIILDDFDTNPLLSKDFCFWFLWISCRISHLEIWTRSEPC